MMRFCFWILLMLASPATAAQGLDAASVQQIPAPGADQPLVGVKPVAASRSSATVQNTNGEKVPPLISPQALAACQAAQAADRPAPAGVDCVKALQVDAAARAAPTAEGSLLNMLGNNANVIGAASVNTSGSANAEQVSRQLSSTDFQGAAGSNAAASVARDRAPPPATTPPPR